MTIKRGGNTTKLLQLKIFQSSTRSVQATSFPIAPLDPWHANSWHFICQVLEVISAKVPKSLPKNTHSFEDFCPA